MAIWLPYKAKPHEKAKTNRRKAEIYPHICKVCGKPLHGGGNMCGTCEKFIRKKQNEERQGIL